MASTFISTPCLRALRNLPRQICYRDTSKASSTRAFTTSLRSFQEPKPQRRPPPPPPPKEYASSSSQQPKPDTFASLASTLRTTQTFRSTTEPYVAYGSTEELYHLCSQPLAYTIPSRNANPPVPGPQNAAGEDLGVPSDPNTFWFRPRSEGGLGLDVTFFNWQQIIFLHMYILTVRLREFPAEHAKIWHQQLLDHFFYAAEERMEVWHGIVARSTRNKYLKDMWTQWRGVIFSYDEGLVKGDAVLAGAVWRNLFKGNVETDVTDLARIVVFLRRDLKAMEALADEEVAEARIRFGDPGESGKVLQRKSGWMSKGFEEGEVGRV